MAEAIDMNELGKEDEGAEDQDENTVEETSLIDDDDRNNLLDTSIIVPTGDNPDFIPNVKRDAGVMKRAFTHDKKDFLKNALKVNLNKNDGPSSTTLFDGLELTIDKRTNKSRLSLTDSEIREIPGILHIEEQDGQTPEEQINILETTEKPHWEQRATEAEAQGKKRRATILRSVADTAQLKADEIRLKQNQVPKSEEVQSMIDNEIQNNVLSIFERFKKWAKENLVGISAVAISVAGIITTIVVSTRKALKAGAKGLSNFAKGVYNLGKKLGPVFGAVLNLIGSILSMGAKGINFLAQNLWILAVAISYFLYEKFKRKK